MRRNLIILVTPLLLFSCSGEESTDPEGTEPEIVLPALQFQNYTEKISYCIGMDHGKVSYQVYNGPKTAGKFNNTEITNGMVDYLTDEKLKVPIEEIDAILDLYLLPGGEVNEGAVNKDDASYAIGLTEAQYLVGSLVGRGIDQEMDPWFLAQGVKAGMESDESVISYREAQLEVRKYYDELSADMGIAFLQDNAKKDSVQQTETGLQYKVITPGFGKKPNLTDTVVVHYTGYFIDGRVFDSSIPSGQPGTFVLMNMIKGWQEGLQLMNEGAQYRLFIPSELGYGEMGSGSVPPNSTLVFDVELIEVKSFSPF